jgi:hypothetical protein
MELKFDPQAVAKNKVKEGKTTTYATFRDAIPRPSSENANLRHILRFYISRALQKRGAQDIYILPDIQVGEKSFKVDILAGTNGKYTAAFCEPGSVTPKTEDLLDVLKDVPDVEVIIVHSQFGNPGNVMSKYSKQLETKQFRLLAVVPPPFDDVYEYDIWMFETTFNDLFTRG